MKKVISLAVAVLLVLSFAGCSTSNQTAAAPSDSQAAVASSAEPSAAASATPSVAASADASASASATMASSAVPARTGKEPAPTKKSGPIKLGFCPSAMNTQYQIVINGAKQQIDEIGKDKIDLMLQAPSSQSASAEQVNTLEGWIEQGVDAIAIATENDAAMTPEYEKAAAKGIPVFEFNMPVALSTDPYFVSNIGYDQYAAGHAVGEWMVQTFKGQDIKLAVLQGLPGVHNTQRLNGFKDAIKDASNLQIVASQPADWSRDKGHTVTENILEAHPEINVIWGMYDEMALGAVAAIKSRGMTGKIKVIGYDNTPDAYTAIKAGEMTATVDTAAKDMGVNLIKAVQQYVMNGEMVPKAIFSPVKVYDQTNINTFSTQQYEYVAKK